MRILIITSEFPLPIAKASGLATHTHLLSRMLARCGHEVIVATYHAGDDLEITKDGLQILIFGPPADSFQSSSYTEFPLRRINDRLAVKIIERLEARDFTPDLIHVHDSYGIYAAIAVSERWRCPLIGTVHLLHRSMLLSCGFELLSPMIEADEVLCRSAAGIIAVSHHMAEEIEALGFRSREEIFVVHNGIEPAVMDNGRCQGLPMRFESTGKKRIVYVGRLTAPKGVIFLLRSSLQVIKEYEPVEYLVVGPFLDFAYKARIEQFFDEHPDVRKHYTFVSAVPQDEVMAFYKTSYMAVVPSIYEPFGLAAVEPMACGVPVVASNVGGLSEIIEDGKSGLLVDCVLNNQERQLNVDQLTRAQLELLRDVSKAEEFGKMGRVRVERAFDCMRMTMETARVYERVLEGRKP